jgi:hypothetical protein
VLAASSDAKRWSDQYMRQRRCNAIGYGACDACVGVERQMRSVLLA